MFSETQKAKDKMTFGFLEPRGLTLPSIQLDKFGSGYIFYFQFYFPNEERIL